MARKLKVQDIRHFSLETLEGASAYDYSGQHPLIHLTFTLGSALLTDGFYQTQQAEVRRLAEALVGAWKVEARFPWQYGAWMRDPRRGKGNRIQGAVVPALLDALVAPSEDNAAYVARCLSHRVDDLMTFVAVYRQLGLGEPSAGARKGLAAALAGFDEYQLMKYTGRGQDLRLCDVIYLVRPELEALGEAGRLALDVGRYLHAPTRARRELMAGLPMTRARSELFEKGKDYALEPAFGELVAQARVTWEQVLGHFGTKGEAQRRNRAVWSALLSVPGLLPDMAFLRNLRNLHQAGFEVSTLAAMASERAFHGVWPHQIYAGSKAAPALLPAFEAAMTRATALLPPGRHLGIGDASGSMTVKVGGLKGSTTAMDVAFCLVGLMSQTSGLGASFDDGTWNGGKSLHVVERAAHQGPLAFAQRPELRRGMGGTQVFGAVMDLIDWLQAHPEVKPPDCLWFFSDMQFHPAGGQAPAGLAEKVKALLRGGNVPPLEAALRLYRETFGPVDVVLWNLAAYAPVPVPAEIKGVLLVSGFDANTLRHVTAWREGKAQGEGALVDNQEVILNHIRQF
jgi:hypothetical protein